MQLPSPQDAFFTVIVVIALAAGWFWLEMQLSKFFARKIEAQTQKRLEQNEPDKLKGDD